MKSTEIPPNQLPELELQFEERQPGKMQQTSKNKNKLPGWLLVVLLLGGYLSV